MNLGTQKWKKARANFAGVRDDAGRCGVACTRACSSQGMGMHAAAKAKARSKGRGMLAWACWHAPGHRQQGPWGHAAKALACTQREGAVASRRWRGMPRAWDAKAVACPWDP